MAIEIVKTAAIVFLLGGCAQIATVKPARPHFVATGAQKHESATAEHRLQEARKLESSNPLRALGYYLDSAHTAYDELRREPGETDSRKLYNFAVARCVAVIESAPLDPWDRSLSVPGPDGDYVLTSLRHPGADRDPADYTIISSDSLIVGGTFFEKRITVEGIGAPVVAVGREEKKDFRKTLASRRLYGTATAIIRFSGRHAQLEFYEPLRTERVALNGRTFPLAADFSAPLAVALTSERPDKLGLIRLLRPEKYAHTAQLVRLQDYDPNRIPIIFVHGLQDTVASWAPMINALREDPEIRRRYQFWVFSYPSGYPYPYSAALFRKELDSVNRAFPNHKGIVLVGHSMGGMVSRLMITDVGDKLWRVYFGKSPAETPLSDEPRQLARDCLIFNHRPEVRRVIFICSPHRGADLASNWIGRIGASLVKTPTFFASIPVSLITAATAGPGVMQLKRIPNSIDTLAPNNRFVLEINKFPITPGIPYHQIEGDRGRGDAPKSSDGVVPYWSSHLGAAESELIVPSNHSAHRNPQAIAEVRRILKLHLATAGIATVDPARPQE